MELTRVTPRSVFARINTCPFIASPIGRGDLDPSVLKNSEIAAVASQPRNDTKGATLKLPDLLQDMLTSYNELDDMNEKP